MLKRTKQIIAFLLAVLMLTTSVQFVGVANATPNQVQGSDNKQNNGKLLEIKEIKLEHYDQKDEPKKEFKDLKKNDVKNFDLKVKAEGCNGYDSDRDADKNDAKVEFKITPEGSAEIMPGKVDPKGNVDKTKKGLCIKFLEAGEIEVEVTATTVPKKDKEIGETKTETFKFNVVGEIIDIADEQVPAGSQEDTDKTQEDKKDSVEKESDNKDNGYSIFFVVSDEDYEDGYSLGSLSISGDKLLPWATNIAVLPEVYYNGEKIYEYELYYKDKLVSKFEEKDGKKIAALDYEMMDLSLEEKNYIYVKPIKAKKEETPIESITKYLIVRALEFHGQFKKLFDLEVDSLDGLDYELDGYVHQTPNIVIEKDKTLDDNNKLVSQLNAYVLRYWAKKVNIKYVVKNEDGTESEIAPSKSYITNYVNKNGTKLVDYKKAENKLTDEEYGKYKIEDETIFDEIEDGYDKNEIEKDGKEYFFEDQKAEMECYTSDKVFNVLNITRYYSADKVNIKHVLYFQPDSKYITIDEETAPVIKGVDFTSNDSIFKSYDEYAIEGEKVSDKKYDAKTKTITFEYWAKRVKLARFLTEKDEVVKNLGQETNYYKYYSFENTLESVRSFLDDKVEKEIIDDEKAYDYNPNKFEYKLTSSEKEGNMIEVTLYYDYNDIKNHKHSYGEAINDEEKNMHYFECDDENCPIENGKVKYEKHIYEKNAYICDVCGAQRKPDKTFIEEKVVLMPGYNTKVAKAWDNKIWENYIMDYKIKFAERINEDIAKNNGRDKAETVTAEDIKLDFVSYNSNGDHIYIFEGTVNADGNVYKLIINARGDTLTFDTHRFDLKVSDETLKEQAIIKAHEAVKKALGEKLLKNVSEEGIKYYAAPVKGVEGKYSVAVMYANGAKFHVEGFVYNGEDKKVEDDKKDSDEEITDQNPEQSEVKPEEEQVQKPSTGGHRRKQKTNNNIASIEDEKIAQAGGAISDLKSTRADELITRSEFAVALGQIYTALNDEKKDEFVDIKGSTDEEILQKLAASGIIKGYSKDTFGPNDLITREQMLLMLSRVIKKADLAPNMSEEEVNKVLAQATDGSQVNDWAKEGVAITVVKELVAKDQINALSNVKRANAADILEGFVKNIISFITK